MNDFAIDSPVYSAVFVRLMTIVLQDLCYYVKILLLRQKR